MRTKIRESLEKRDIEQVKRMETRNVKQGQGRGRKEFGMENREQWRET